MPSFFSPSNGICVSSHRFGPLHQLIYKFMILRMNSFGFFQWINAHQDIPNLCIPLIYGVYLYNFNKIETYGGPHSMDGILIVFGCKLNKFVAELIKSISCSYYGQTSFTWLFYRASTICIWLLSAHDKFPSALHKPMSHACRLHNNMVMVASAAPSSRPEIYATCNEMDKSSRSQRAGCAGVGRQLVMVTLGRCQRCF